jgi:hypothetical protein
MTICDLSRSFAARLEQITAASLVCPSGMSRRKAAVNRAHSKRFAKFEDARQSRLRLDCACFSTAFDSMFDVRCSAFDVRRSMFGVRCSAFDVRRSMFDVLDFK